MAASHAEKSPQSLQRKEDWSVLSIRGMDLDIKPAIITEHDAGPAYTRDLVRVQWRDGDSIELFVFTPNGVKKAPAILYLYSYPSDVDRFFDPGWATRATANGFAAVGFVSALTGQRYRMRPMKEWFVSELQESLGTSVHDVQMILDYLASRGDIDTDHVGMFGQGSGGAIAIMAAYTDPRIKALDLLDPWGDWPDWLKDSTQIPEDERQGFLKPEFLRSVAHLDPIDYLPELKTQKLRVQQILNDSTTPSSAMNRIAKAAPSTGDVVQYQDSAAHYQALHTTGVSRWLKEQLTSEQSSPNTPVPKQ